LPARFCPTGQFGQPTHIAHICKSHCPTHKSKFAKECNFSTTKKYVQMVKGYPIEFTEIGDEILIKFNINKFGTKHLDLFSNLFYKYLSKRKKFSFDLSNLSWISHEELVYLSAILDQLYVNDLSFRVIFTNENPSIRQIKTIIYVWETWQIFSFLPKDQILSEIDRYFDLSAINSEETKKTLKVFFNITDETLNQFIKNIENQISKKQILNSIALKYFDIDVNDILELKKTLSDSIDIDLENNFYKITPFVKLNVPNGELDERLISENLNRIYKLDDKTRNLLNSHSSDTPFLNHTLSLIISKELYENSIEHAYKTKNIKNPSCYLSVTLRNKIKEDGAWDADDINLFNKMNFENEAIKESKSFFVESELYKNQSLLQFTFIDFGSGIPNSLEKQAKSILTNPDDTEILEYAFNYTSSRFPLHHKYLEKNSIPRGLFDVISIVKRYKGLLNVRSNYGKLIYDFSLSDEIEKCVIKYDKTNSKYFNGTIITILIPENNFGIELKTIKPQYLIDASIKTPYYLSILDIQKKAIKKVKTEGNNELIKKQLYNETLDCLSSLFDARQNENCTIFIDFNGCFLESQISKKILFFLASDYRINEKTNAVVFNPPSRELVLEIQLEILNSPIEKQNFIFHPIPCLFQTNLETEIIWIGISEKKSYEKLNNVLYSLIHNEVLSDFENKNTILDSGIFHYDEHGNIKTLVGIIDDQCVFRILSKAILKETNAIYLCSGNYYQYEYIELLEQLYDFDEAIRISRLLHKSVNLYTSNFYEGVTHFLAITLSSQLIASSFISQLQEDISNKIEFVKLSNYHSYHLEDEFIQNINEGDRIIVVCDVISTGYLITSLKEKLSIKNAILHGVISIFDTRTAENKGSIKMFYEEDVPTISLRNVPIDKYKRTEIDNIIEKKVIRINPVTNTQITLEVNKSELKETVLLNEIDFLSIIDFPEDFVKIGYFKYNKLFHPYFFETHKLFSSTSGTRVLKTLINEISSRIELSIDFIFYPIFSGAEEVNSFQYKSEVFNNQNIEFIPLARFNTPIGWRFTFPPKFLNSKTVNSDVFILDDGSCTGATIIQMIDEISFLDVNSITLLSVVGRTDDYLREFYSRIKTVKVKHLSDDLVELFSSKKKKYLDNKIPLNIFFGTQWHVPTYSIGSSFPFLNEQKQLNYLVNIDNLPSILNKYVTSRLKKLSLTNTEDNCILKYLPTDSNDKVPIIDLLLTRNQFGKINGYRFYKDYFFGFDDYVNNFYKNEGKYTLKQTELFLSVLLHEPYIIQSIQDFLPDVFEILLNITKTIVTNYDNSESLNFNILNYNWERASFVSIYLNLRKNKVKEVFSSDNLNSLLSFISLDETSNSLRIFLMYILNYVPMSKAELTKQEDGIYCLKEITNFINKEEINIKPKIYSNLKLFKSFLNTIPYLDKDLVSKRACLDKMVQFFNDEKSIRTHDSIERQLGIIKTQSNLIPLSKDLFANESKVNEIKEAWKIILPRMEQLQRYASRLIGFFNVYRNGIINQDLFYSDNNLLKINRDLSEIIENNRIVDNWATIHDYTKNKLLSNFFTEQAFIYQLFLNFETQQIISLWNEVMNERIKKINIENTKYEIDKINNLTIDFPLLYLKDVVFIEIRRNFRYSDIDESIKIKWIVSNDKLELIIKNKLGVGKKGGKNGFQTFELLTKILDFEFMNPYVDSGFYIQKYKFKIK
jgi:hypoxanthine-guanine phosphoribosyltransferase